MCRYAGSITTSAVDPFGPVQHASSGTTEGFAGQDPFAVAKYDPFAVMAKPITYKNPFAVVPTPVAQSNPFAVPAAIQQTKLTGVDDNDTEI